MNLTPSVGQSPIDRAASSRAPRPWIRLAGSLAMLSFFLGVLSPAVAQIKTVQVAGRVQWIAAGKMMVIPDNGGLPVYVDITQVNQDQYKSLTEGAPVTVIGAVAPDGPRVIATTITPGRGQ